MGGVQGLTVGGGVGRGSLGPILVGVVRFSLVGTAKEGFTLLCGVGRATRLQSAWVGIGGPI